MSESLFVSLSLSLSLSRCLSCSHFIRALDCLQNVVWLQFPHLPLAVYQVSGEYAMLYHAAQAGALGLK